MSSIASVPRRRTRRFVAALLACAVAVGGQVLLGSSAPAHAHATLIGTDPSDGAVVPQSPPSATLTFNEPVILPEDGVTVYDADGEVVPASASSRDAEVVVDLPDLEEGTYVVVWNVVSTDAHPIAGSLSFSVGSPSARVAEPRAPSVATGSWLDAVIRGLHYLGLFVGLGLAVFLGLLLPAGVRAEPARRRLRVVATAAAVIAVAAGGALFARSVLPHGALVSWALLSGGLGLALVPAWVNRLAPARSRALTMGGGLLTASAPAVVGHTRGFGPEALVIATDVLHVAAGSVWLGGLIGLGVTLPILRHRPADAVRTVSRFSTTAAGLLAALVASGLLLSWRILGSWDNLLHTSYGTLLLIKVGLVAVAAAMAGWNRYVLLPRGQGVTRTVRVEAAVLVGVLAVTGVLVDRSPVATQALVRGVEPQVASAAMGDYRVLATIAPLRTGTTTLRIQLQDASGEPVEPPYPPDVSLRSPDVDLGGVDVVSEAAGTWSAPVVLPRAGEWSVQVSLRLSTFDNPVAVMQVEVPAG